MIGRRALIAKGREAAARALHLSPGIVAGDLVFLTGMTGAFPDGTMPVDTEMQIRSAFDKIGEVLALDGLDHAAIVEMTSYHVGLREHFDLFNAIRSDYVREPFPAWTAVEVAGLRRAGAIVEIRVVAMRTGAVSPTACPA
jgi:enamine deaminase RidA (YjgF/YER057c/UK114 family)